MVNTIPILIEKEIILKQLEKGSRSDGRGLYDYRPIKIDFDVISKANGSASVKIGNTYILVGVKAEIGKPFPDTPDEGVLIVNSEFVPLASPQFEAGPPDENSIELSRVVDRGLRHGKAVDLKDLCIIPNEKVWIIWVDVYVLDYGGTLFDATALAALAALMTTKIPITKVENSQVIICEEKKQLKIIEYPLCVTINKISNYMFIDPSIEEMNFVEGTLTIFTTSKGEICAVQKSSVAGFIVDDIINALDIVKNKSEYLRSILIESFNNWRNSQGVK